MVWVCPSPQAIFDVDGLLDALATDLAAYGLDTFHHYETRVLQRRINWKLAVEHYRSQITLSSGKTDDCIKLPLSPYPRQHGVEPGFEKRPPASGNRNRIIRKSTPQIDGSS